LDRDAEEKDEWRNLEPVDTVEGPLVRKRRDRSDSESDEDDRLQQNHQRRLIENSKRDGSNSDSDEDDREEGIGQRHMIKPSSDQMDANDEGALRLPRGVDKEVSTPVEAEEGGSHLHTGPRPSNDDEEEKPLIQRNRRRRELKKPCKTGRSVATGEDGWWMAPENAERRNHRVRH
jgi:hypothetical protein